MDTRIDPAILAKATPAVAVAMNIPFAEETAEIFQQIMASLNEPGNYDLLMAMNAAHAEYIEKLLPILKESASRLGMAIP